MSAEPGGRYPIETREGEIARLEIQAVAMAPNTEVMLDRIGVGPGADLRIARRLFQLARGCGLLDVQYRTCLLGVRAGDPLVDYLPSTVESPRGTILGPSLASDAELTDTLVACRAHLGEPDTVFTMYTAAQVWGRTPASGARPDRGGRAAGPWAAVRGREPGGP